MGKSSWQSRPVGSLLICAAMLKIPALGVCWKSGPWGSGPVFWEMCWVGADTLWQLPAIPAISSPGTGDSRELFEVTGEQQGPGHKKTFKVPSNQSIPVIL